MTLVITSPAERSNIHETNKWSLCNKHRSIKSNHESITSHVACAMTSQPQFKTSHIILILTHDFFHSFLSTSPPILTPSPKNLTNVFPPPLPIPPLLKIPNPTSRNLQLHSTRTPKSKMVPNLLPRPPLNLHRNAISLPTLALGRVHAAESAPEPLARGQRFGGRGGSGGGGGVVGGEVDGAAGEAFAEFVDGLMGGGGS